MDTTPLPISPLEYARPDGRPTGVPPWRAAALRVVLACWAIPFVVGCVVFAVAFVFGRGMGSKVADAGAINTYAGTALAAVGVVSILLFLADRWQLAAGDRWSLVLWPALCGCSLLASNFLVAVLFITILFYWDKI